jgi:hypothetical protein
MPPTFFISLIYFNLLLIIVDIVLFVSLRHLKLVLELNGSHFHCIAKKI